MNDNTIRRAKDTKVVEVIEPLQVVTAGDNFGAYARKVRGEEKYRKKKKRRVREKERIFLAFEKEIIKLTYLEEQRKTEQ